VHSFDYDPDSVACARALRAEFLPDDPGWTIEQGSALDAEYLHRLGRHDIVYSWGVLHHTGDQWRALALIDDCVADAGVLVLALYNDQGPWSRWWRLVKQTYVGSPAPVRTGLVVAVGACLETKAVLGRLVRGEALLAPLWSSSRERGMHRWIDLVDWVGGYPFEVSTPEQVFEFYRERGYTLTHLRTCGAGGGCNEFVFRRIPTDESSRQPGEP
jgi:2-polyprenyl-6-hydroxyphenyl methylase/3-demethylubiquinone-9 3-methyltransferase